MLILVKRLDVSVENYQAAFFTKISRAFDNSCFDASEKIQGGNGP
jgi:hypothetical protein